MRTYENYKEVTDKPESQEAIRIQKEAVKEMVRGFNLREETEDEEFKAKDIAERFANISFYFFKHLQEVEEFAEGLKTPKEMSDLSGLICGWWNPQIERFQWVCNIFKDHPEGWDTIERIWLNVYRSILRQRIEFERSLEEK